jgi:transcriptional regulator with XRE-family HTH domain
MTAPSTFPSRLSWWRRKRGLSQLQLAMNAACSQRHISFLELGRTRPSREMVVRLSGALDLPLRQSNELLLAAGFAPAWAETKLDAARLAPIREALDYILAQQEPYPAVVVDRRWNLLEANKGAVAMVEFLVGPIKPGTAINLADALVAPDVLRPHLVNWSEVVRYFVRSVEADTVADATPETAALLDRLLNYKGVRATISQLPSTGDDAPILPHALREGWDQAPAVHDGCNPGDATGHHLAGAADREFLPDGRGDARNVSKVVGMKRRGLLRKAMIEELAPLDASAR